MKQHLAVSAIGSDRTGMVHDLSRVISDCGGSISESRMASLGNEFAILVLVSGNWHSLAKLESELARLGEATGLSLHMKRTEPRAPRTELLPYSIDVVCLDQAGIVTGLSGVLCQPRYRHCRSVHAHLPRRAYRRADVRRTNDYQRPQTLAARAPARGVHGLLRRPKSRRDPGARKVLSIAVGKKVPAFSLPRSDGSLWKSADAKGGKLVLYFYPKDMTPGCTLEGQDFRDLHAAFKRAHTTVLGVSKDSCERHAKFRAKENSRSSCCPTRMKRFAGSST
jgi:predicted amino acid-binding ACT domain protein